MLTLSQLKLTIKEKDEHKRSPVYKKLAPNVKKAIDDLYVMMAKQPQKVLTTFPKIVRDVSKKYRVQPKDIETYFAKETGLTI